MLMPNMKSGNYDWTVLSLNDSNLILLNNYTSIPIKGVFFIHDH